MQNLSNLTDVCFELLNSLCFVFLTATPVWIDSYTRTHMHATATKRSSTRKQKLGSILSINTNKDLKWQHRDTLGPTKLGSFVTARRQLPATGPEEPAGSRRFCTSGLRGREECGRGRRWMAGAGRPVPCASAVLMRRQHGPASVFIRHLGQQMWSAASRRIKNDFPSGLPKLEKTRARGSLFHSR